MTDVVERKSPVAQRLLAATIATIDVHGESAVRVQDVVKGAGTQIPVLYRHFGNREGLLQAAQLLRLRRDLEEELEVVDAAIGSVETAEEFRAIVDTLLARAASPERRLHRARRVNVIGSSLGRPELIEGVAAAQKTAIVRIANVFERPAARGWLREGLDLQTFASWLGGAVLGRVVLEVDPSQIDLERYDEMWFDAVRHVMFG